MQDNCIEAKTELFPHHPERQAIAIAEACIEAARWAKVKISAEFIFKGIVQQEYFRNFAT